YYSVQTGYLTETKVITYTDPATYVYPGPITETKVISDNGGGLYFIYATGAFTNNTFTENEATANGGGLYIAGSDVKFWNTLIAQNNIYVGSYITDTDTYFAGSGALIASSTAEFYHSTIADNTNLHGTTALTDTTGLYISMRAGNAASTVTTSNNIFANQDVALYAGEGSSQVLGTSNVWWNSTERHWSNNLFDDFAAHYFGDPQFVDAAAGDYRIKAESAAFDVGTDIEGLDTDIEGQPRLRGFAPDAGAYEQHFTKGLYLTQSASSDIIADTQTFKYTVRIANHSSAAVSNVQFQDTIPAPQVLLSVSSSGSTTSCTTNPCSLGTLQPEQVVTIVLTVKVVGKPPVGQIQELVNRVTLSSTDIVAGASHSQNDYSTYLQEVVLGSAPALVSNSTLASEADAAVGSLATTAVHTGGCRIHLNGKDYATLTAALAASLDDTDVVKVSGNCAVSTTTVKYKVTIQGGWSTDLTELDPTKYPTTLQAVGGRHFTLDGEIEPVIENFKLTGGTGASGGSILVNGAGGTLRNLHITGNSATSKGGGIYIGPNSVPVIEQSLIENNSASSGGGGVAFVESGATLKDSIVQNNTGPSDGGGIYLDNSGAQIMRVTVKGHSVSGNGGGIYMSNSPAQVMGGSITNNSAGKGGGIYADKSAATVADNLIQNNSASKSSKTLYLFYVMTGSGGGGGIYAEESAIRIMRNRILANSAPDGGGVYLWSAPSAALLEGNVIARNSGGGIFIRQLSPLFKVYIIFPPLLLPDLTKNPLAPMDLPTSAIAIRHNTIINNSGKGIWVVGRAYVALANNIISGNSGTGVDLKTESIPHLYFLFIPGFGFLIPIVIPIPTFYAPKATIDHTLWGPGGKSTAKSESVFASLSTSNDLTGHLAFKPDGYHIKRISTAYAAGANSDVSLDIDVETRVQGGTVDIGADEYTFRDTLYVTPSGNDTEADIRKRCRDWKKPCSLQQALEAASEGSLLKLSGGSYTQVYTKEGQSQVAYVDKTITIQGGYYVAESSQYDDSLNGTANKKDWEYPYPSENPSILNAGGTGRALYIVGDEVKPEIFGVHLIGGNASAAGMNGLGGGVYVISATATISNVQIYNNVALSGGGTYLHGSPSTIRGSTIKNNTATSGAGIYISATDALIQENTLQSNKATDGGAFYITTGKSKVISNTLSLNEAIGNGGGIYLSSSDEVIIEANTLSTNTAAVGGGGLYAVTSTGMINRNTLTGNIASEGGGFYFKAGEDKLTLNVVSANKATKNGGGYFLNAAASSIVSDTVRSNTAPTGGGFYMVDAKPSGINGVIIESNIAASDGGAAYLLASAASFANSQINNNQAGLGGGALYVNSFSAATLTGSTLNNNRATQDGGAIYVKLSETSLENSMIMTNTARSGAGIYMKLGSGVIAGTAVSGNKATLLGGGIYLEESATEVSGGSLIGNTAQDGAGIYMVNSNSASLVSTTVLNNIAANNGGGAFLSSSNIIVQGNTFRGNKAISGGGLYVSGSKLTLSETVVAANEATLHGGGLLLMNGSDSTIQNLAVVDNRATNLGSGLYISASSPELAHITFARNSGGNGTGIHATDDGVKFSTISVLNSIVVDQIMGINVTEGSSATLETTFWGVDDTANDEDWGGEGTIVTGTTHIRGVVAFDTDGYHLSPDSAAIDEAGMPAIVMKDVDGEDRPRGDAPDIGADEYVPRTCFAQLSSNPSMSYTTVQAAVDAAIAGDTVKVAGTCLGVQRRNGLTQSVYVDKNITIRGGYSIDDWTTSYPISQTTTIGAGSAGRIFYITGDVAPVIENLRLSGGSANTLGGGPLGADSGGAVYVNGSRPIFRNNDILSSNAKYGGGFYLKASTASLIDNQIINNKADNGGGVYLDTSNAIISGNYFEKNLATNGAGIFIGTTEDATITNNTLTGNIATYGGAFFLDRSSTTVEGNEVLTNTARSGGAFYLDLSAASVVSNTIRANVASLENGGGIYLGFSNATVDNNIIEGNSAVNVGGGIYLNGSAATISRSTVFSNTAKSGGGIYLDVSNSTLVNNFVTHNRATATGSGVYLVGSVVTIKHNTFAGNSGGDGSALYLTSSSSKASQATMSNSIVASHQVGVALAAGNTIDSKATIWYNNMSKTVGTGTLTTSVADVVGNPAFVDANAYDYHILKASVALDAGISSDLTLDVDGQPRPGGEGYDVGADEYYQPEMVLSISSTPEPAVAGDTFTYLYRVNNTGNIDLHGIVTASLPVTVTPSGVMTWTNVTIGQGSTWEQNVSVSVPITYAGSLPTTMYATMQEGAKGSHGYTATSERPEAGIEASVLASATVVKPGDKIRYTLVVRNTGNVTVNARVTNTIPSQVTTTALDPLTFSLASGNSWVHSYDATVDTNATGTLTNKLDVTTLQGVSRSATATTLIGQPALQIHSQPSGDPVVAGKPMTYTLVLTNTGNITLTSAITNTFPQGVTPNTPKLWSQSIAPGVVWTQKLSVTVQPGFSGLLTNTLQITTKEGLSGSHTTTVLAQLPKPGPTIQSVKNGNWEDASTWTPSRVPNESDVVLVNSDHTLDSTCLFTVAGLENRGILLCSSSSAVVTVTLSIYNSGQILGHNGAEATTTTAAEAGGTIEVRADTISNTGTIQAGDGGDALGAGTGGAGGSVTVIVPTGALLNSPDGEILAGNGGASPAGVGGPGGAATVEGDNAVLDNKGLIKGGDGGDGSATAAASSSGGAGGPVSAE
ncbi:MAG: right-handed parallel beta-helix repeat-containing protein, partial [Ardenticatenales bacterium]|nr:right-handed parallel beta-helix repeat-containing protein [Ardenticatenales bacterium]